MRFALTPLLAARRIIRSGRFVASAAWPNLIFLFPFIAIVVGLSKREELRYREIFVPAVNSYGFDFGRIPGRRMFGFEYHSDKWVYETVVLLGFLLTLMLLLLIVFDRGSHRRRWARKPPEVERASRYFMG